MNYSENGVKNLINTWKSEKRFTKLVTTEELLFLINKMNSDEELDILRRDFDKIIEIVQHNNGICEFYIILNLFVKKIYKEKCQAIIEKILNNVNDDKTRLFIKNIFIKSSKDNKFTSNEIADIIINELNKKETIESSNILINLYSFNDFKKEIKKRFPTASYIIEKNIEAYPTAKERQQILGESIIGKLVRDNNENIIKYHFDYLKKEEELNDRDIKIIGAGSCCIVFKCGSKVLKIGEDRHNRKIFINHRILASQNRRLYYDKEGNPLFYIETMKFAKVGDVTKEERDELVEDLRAQGLIWEDTKLENCGVLMPDDDNEWNFEGNYDEEIAGIADFPAYKEEFQKRKRRVVVIDNDYIRRNPKFLWR